MVALEPAVDPLLLKSLVPPGTELDTFEEKTYISLVGFEFNRTRVLGWAVPFHQNFEEVNLRFYVRRGSKRGVVFIRELVPKYAVAAIARWAFNESYSCVPMSHRIESGTLNTRAVGPMCDEIEARGEFSAAGGLLGPIHHGTLWGYASQKAAAAGCEVQHPPWSVWNAKAASFLGMSMGCMVAVRGSLEA
jgi:uncharacterized protein YqjF (DUF2071 family)